MRVSASKLLGDPGVEALPPQVQWATLEAAYKHFGTASAGNVVPLLLILTLQVATGAMWPFAWFIAALGATLGGRLAAKKFRQIAAGAPVAFHVRRYTIAASAQMVILGAGGLGAGGVGVGTGGVGVLGGGQVEFCALAALPIGFAMMNVCATARMARASSLQMVLLGAPIVAACTIQCLRGHGAPPFAFLACVFALWSIGAGLLAREAAARNHLYGLAVLEGSRAATAAGVKPDISATENFQRLHGRDQVTGLLNGHSLAHVLTLEGTRAALAELPLSLILLDWDGYESFAARRTPQETAAKLIDIAQRVRGALRRQHDEIARLSDGRFGIVLAGTDAFGAHVVAQNLVAAVNRTPGDSPPGAVAVPVKLSIGIATYSGHGALPETQLMQFAGDALRHAKVNGGSQIRRHDEAAHAMRPATQKLPHLVHKKLPGPVIDGVSGAATLSVGHALEQAK